MLSSNLQHPPDAPHVKAVDLFPVGPLVIQILQATVEEFRQTIQLIELEIGFQISGWVWNVIFQGDCAGSGDSNSVLICLLDPLVTVWVQQIQDYMLGYSVLLFYLWTFLFQSNLWWREDTCSCQAHVQHCLCQRSHCYSCGWKQFWCRKLPDGMLVFLQKLFYIVWIVSLLILITWFKKNNNENLPKMNIILEYDLNSLSQKFNL